MHCISARRFGTHQGHNVTNPSGVFALKDYPFCHQPDQAHSFLVCTMFGGGDAGIMAWLLQPNFSGETPVCLDTEDSLFTV